MAPIGTRGTRSRHGTGWVRAVRPLMLLCCIMCWCVLLDGDGVQQRLLFCCMLRAGGIFFLTTSWGFSRLKTKTRCHVPGIPFCERDTVGRFSQLEGNYLSFWEPSKIEKLNSLAIITQNARSEAKNNNTQTKSEAVRVYTPARAEQYVHGAAC